MKKILSLFQLAILIILWTSTIYGNTEITVTMDNNLLIFDQPPVIINDRVMVPVRAIFEAFGANLYWDEATSRITAWRATEHITLQVGSNDATISGMLHSLDAPPFIVPETGRTLVPLRFISEAFGADVAWDGNRQSVTINTNQVAWQPTIQPLTFALEETPVWVVDSGGSGVLNPEDDPTRFIDTGAWSPYYRSEIVGGFYFNNAGWRISESSYHEKMAERDRILAEIITPDMSAFEMIRAVHSWLAYNVTYNTDAFSRERWGGNGWNPNFRPVRYESEHQTGWSALVLRTTVCAGYSQAFIYLLEPLGIEALYVTGPVIFHDGSPNESHAWNLVQLDSNWYHVDVTWNRVSWGNRYVVVYDWFLRSDSSVRSICQSTTRSWDTSVFPAARRDFSWDRPQPVFDHNTNDWRHRAEDDDSVFNVTTSVSDTRAGTVTATPGHSQPRQWIVVQAQPNQGYSFSHWEVVSGNITFIQAATSAWNTFSMPTSDVSIRAVFVQGQNPDQTPGQVPGQGQGHSVSMSVNDSRAGTATANFSSNVPQGQMVSINVQQNQGFEFSHWEVTQGNVQLQNQQSMQTSFVMPAGNVALRAVFNERQNVPLSTVEVSVNNIQAGTAGSNYISGLVPGRRVTLSAQASHGFEFSRWEVVSGGVSIFDTQSTSTIFYMGEENVSIRAIFNEQMTLNIQSGNPQAGTVNQGVGHFFREGDYMWLEARANHGFEFSHWDITSGNAVLDDRNSANTRIHMSNTSVTVVAAFREIERFTVSVSNSEGGTVHVSQELNLPGAFVSLNANANHGYEFSHWEVISGNISINTQARGVNFDMPHGNVSIRAVFSAIQTLHVHVNVNIPQAGIASPSLGAGLQTGQWISLSASAHHGFEFSHWEVTSGNASIDAPHSSWANFQMPNGNVYITAIFRQVETHW